jgi:hypothetical protein
MGPHPSAELVTFAQLLCHVVLTGRAPDVPRTGVHRGHQRSTAVSRGDP